MKQPPVNIKNKRATFDYELIDTYTAGIVLTGTEIKSIRLGKASLVDTFCYFVKGELWVKNMHIAEYFYGSYNNHTARRDRKLLLSRKETSTGNEESRVYNCARASFYQRKRFGETGRCFGER